MKASNYTGIAPSSPTTDVNGPNQSTQPSVPLSQAKPRSVLGDSGVRMLHGIIMDEYNPQLQGTQGIKIFDEMRKNDGTVRALLTALKLPIRRAQWFVNPATKDPKDKEIAEFVEHALFDWLEGMTWDDFITQSLLHLDFGVMLFEKVYTLKEHDGKQYVTLAKLAPRLPKSILKWELNDGTFGIQQIRQDGTLSEIPASKMLIFINEREGDNWWGLSVLRAPYKHWYYKDNFYKIDAVAFERQGMGVPYVKMPDGYTDADERKAVSVVQNLRANASANVVIPQGYEVGFLDMGGKTTRDPQESIAHHDKMILMSGLVQFILLGSQHSGGSRAVSQDHSDLFLKGEESVANNIGDVINKQLIPELVNLNFKDVTVYPILDCSGISKADVAALSTAYSNLVNAGALDPTDDDQQYLRAAMGLPPRSQEDIDAETEDEPSSEEQRDNANIEEEEPTEPTKTNPAVEDAADEVDEEDEPVPQVAQKTKKAAKQSEKKTAKAKPPKPAAAKAKKTAHEHKPLPRIFDDGNGFTSWRPLMFSEIKVSWRVIQDKMDSLESAFGVEATKLLTDAKNAFVKKLHAAMDAGDASAISEAEIKFEDEYKALLKRTMKAAYDFAKNNAAREMGVDSPPATADTVAEMDALADTIAKKTSQDIETAAKLAATNALRSDKSALQSAGVIDADIEQMVLKIVTNTAGTVIGQSINAGRNDVFERNADMIYALQRSEILDEATCNFCLSMDAMVVDIDDPWAKSETYHTNCRGIWVEILKDEQNPPEITGVPDDIAKYYGGTTNDLKQPKTPIVKPDSLAAKELEKRDRAE